MEKEKSKEYQYLDHAYRVLDFERNRAYRDMTEENKKLCSETLEYLDTLMQKLDADRKHEGEDCVDVSENDDMMTAYKERCLENVELRRQLTATMKELINANNYILSLQEKLIEHSKTSLVSYSI